MYRFALDLTSTLDELQKQISHALEKDTSSAAVNASGKIMEQIRHAKSVCHAICDTTLKQSPLAAMAQDQLGSPKKGSGVHDFVKAQYTPAPPRAEDEQVLSLKSFSPHAKHSLTNCAAAAYDCGGKVYAAAADEVRP